MERDAFLTLARVRQIRSDLYLLLMIGRTDLIGSVLVANDLGQITSYPYLLVMDLPQRSDQISINC